GAAWSDRHSEGFHRIHVLLDYLQFLKVGCQAVKILLVEDDEGFAESLRRVLIEQNYCVDLAADGQSGWDLAEAFEYDLILLDRQLPKLDGIQFCQRLRQRKDSTPVLFLTAQDSSYDKVVGLDAGADDYLAKPIDLQELLARMRSLLRRSSVPVSVLAWGRLQLDLKACQFTYADVPLSLTLKEYGLLELFLRNQQRIFSQQALIEHLWSLEATPTENAVRAHIKSLRQKLKKAGSGDLIETIYGFGYRLNVRELDSISSSYPQGVASSYPQGVASSYPQEVALSYPPEVAVPKAFSTAIAPEFSAVWQQHRQKYLDRVQILNQAATNLKTGTLSPDLEQQALREAHTLIGSLGSFGLDKAADLSRQIQELLKQILSDDSLRMTPSNRSKITLLNQTVNALRETLLAVTIVAPVSMQTTPSEGQTARLLIVDDDVALIDQLMASLSAGTPLWKIEAIGATSLAEAREIIQQQPPDVILLDLSFPDSIEDGFGLLAEVASFIPVIVFTASEGFVDRVRVARLGGRSFLQKPISSSQVIATVVHVLQQSNQTQTKLMMVDDDPQVLDFLRTILQPWGFHLTLVDQPQQAWQLLEQVNPDLLILNIEMPGLNGIDLCQVIRNDRRWDALPVLFLSAHSDSQTIAQVFGAGADDYVSKPIVESELVARVLNRLERVQLLRQFVAQTPNFIDSDVYKF
ncbi:response regulator, partial [Phormidesmis sp. 146-12]